MGVYFNSDISHYIDECIHVERDRAMLKRKLVDGVGYERLAEEFGYSVRQTFRIVKNAKLKLEMSLKCHGYDILT